MAYVLKGRTKDGRFRVRYVNASGVEVQVSVRADSARDAHDAGRDLEREARKLRKASTPESRAWTLGQLVEEWCKSLPKDSAGDKDRSAAKRVLAHAVAAMRLDDLESFHVERFLGDLKLAPASKRKTFGLLSRSFKWAKKFGHWTGANPIEGVEPPEVEESRVGDHLEPHEVAPLLRALPPRWRALFACALFTGLRKGELAALRREDVDLPGRMIDVRRSWERQTTRAATRTVFRSSTTSFRTSSTPWPCPATSCSRALAATRSSPRYFERGWRPPASRPGR